MSSIGSSNLIELDKGAFEFRKEPAAKPESADRTRDVAAHGSNAEGVTVNKSPSKCIYHIKDWIRIDDEAQARRNHVRFESDWRYKDQEQHRKIDEVSQIR